MGESPEPAYPSLLDEESQGSDRVAGAFPSLHSGREQGVPQKGEANEGKTLAFPH